jgi:hypothetical protein
MVYVLWRYDGQRIPDWGSLSFNTLISILAVVSKMAALYGATSAISQLKWVWLTEHGKNLIDYKTFDSGSRGVTGAAMLAWSLKGRYVALPTTPLFLFPLELTHIETGASLFSEHSPSSLVSPPVLSRSKSSISPAKNTSMSPRRRG